MKLKTLAFALTGPAFTLAQPALASDDDFELWFGPSVSTKLDDDTSVELQTAQRFRDQGNNREDTYYFRGWVHQKVAKNVTLSGSIEERINDEGADEIRTIQQLGTKHGVLRTRLRLEERFVEGNGGRMGLRVRPRLGLRVPLGDDSPITASVDGELFWTLRATSVTGSTGINGVETRVGFTYDVNDNLTLGLKYLRAQNIRDNRPDTVSHAPLIEIEFTF
ncbi:MAG: DUF2490 domain-containing protein [Alphaproteobacteria bacterium]|nr:DUF2490 domain-containing protein [Alphaproteobacteria bacterium]